LRGLQNRRAEAKKWFCSDVVRVLFGRPSVKHPFYRTRSEGDPNSTRRKIKLLINWLIV